MLFFQESLPNHVRNIGLRENVCRLIRASRNDIELTTISRQLSRMGIENMMDINIPSLSKYCCLENTLERDSDKHRSGHEYM